MATGKGFADIVYLLKAEYSKSVPALIIELNFNKSASKALEQIKERNYLDKVREYYKPLSRKQASPDQVEIINKEELKLCLDKAKEDLNKLLQRFE